MNSPSSRERPVLLSDIAYPHNVFSDRSIQWRACSDILASIRGGLGGVLTLGDQRSLKNDTVLWIVWEFHLRSQQWCHPCQQGSQVCRTLHDRVVAFALASISSAPPFETELILVLGKQKRKSRRRETREGNGWGSRNGKALRVCLGDVALLGILDCLFLCFRCSRDSEGKDQIICCHQLKIRVLPSERYVEVFVVAMGERDKRRSGREECDILSIFHWLSS